MASMNLRNLRCLIVSLGVVTFSQALAADPPTPASAPAATSLPAETPTAAAADDPAAAAAAAKANAEAKTKAIDKRLRAQGYKPTTSNGIVRYCRQEQVIGSRFERSICGTPEELDMAAQIGKDATETMQRVNGSQRTCLSGSC